MSFFYYQDIDPKTDINGSNSSLNYYGAVVDIQPEYRFTSWFALGLDVELGGYSGEHFYFQSYITTKFTASLNALDLWGEVGFGPGTMVGDYYYSYEVEHGATWTLLARVKVGATYRFNESSGIGIHVGVASGIPAPSVFVVPGVHYSYKF